MATSNQYATDRASIEKDTDITFFIGSGPGGQNRNKVESGVRLRHPSGIVVEAEDARTQGQNRKLAFERLKARLEILNNPPAPRIFTKVSRSEKRARLQKKRIRSARKQDRQPPPME